MRGSGTTVMSPLSVTTRRRRLAMIIQRGRGEPFAHWYGFTDKWRARWNTDEEWYSKYGA